MSNNATPRSAVEAHLAKTCRDAGLGVMVSLFEVLLDRETVDEQALLGVTAEDVTELY